MRKRTALLAGIHKGVYFVTLHRVVRRSQREHCREYPRLFLLLSVFPAFVRQRGHRSLQALVCGTASRLCPGFSVTALHLPTGYWLFSGRCPRCTFCKGVHGNRRSIAAAAKPHEGATFEAGRNAGSAKSLSRD